MHPCNSPGSAMRSIAGRMSRRPVLNTSSHMSDLALSQRTTSNSSHRSSQACCSSTSAGPVPLSFGLTRAWPSLPPRNRSHAAVSSFPSPERTEAQPVMTRLNCCSSLRVIVFAP